MIVLMVWASVYGTSCKKNQEPGGTAMQKMSGDWYVNIGNDEETFFALSTFNTSDNSSTQIWIQAGGLSDEGVSIGIKGKINADLASQTFSGSNIPNIGTSAGDNPTFSISNGRIVTNGTEGPGSGTPTDAISFDLNIDGHTYKISGYHQTGFLEDQQ